MMFFLDGKLFTRAIFFFCLAASSLPLLRAELDFYPIDSDLEIRNEKKESTSRLLKVVKMR